MRVGTFIVCVSAVISLSLFLRHVGRHKAADIVVGLFTAIFLVRLFIGG